MTINPKAPPGVASPTAPGPASLQPGDTFHWLKTGISFLVSEAWGAAEISKRGLSVCVTEAMIRASRDRLGRSWLLDLIDDEQTQIRRWGEVAFRRGPFPDGVAHWTPGTPEHDESRDLARAAAWALPAGPERDRTLADVNATYGHLKTSRTLWEQPQAPERIEWVAGERAER